MRKEIFKKYFFQWRFDSFVIDKRKRQLTSKVKHTNEHEIHE